MAFISRTSRTVKPTAKAKDAIILQAADQLSRRDPKAKAVALSQRTPPSPQQSLEVEDLIVLLTRILENWDNNESTLAALATKVQGVLAAENTSLESDVKTQILAAKIHSANAIAQDHFAYSTQLDAKEPETAELRMIRHIKLSASSHVRNCTSRKPYIS